MSKVKKVKESEAWTSAWITHTDVDSAKNEGNSGAPLARSVEQVIFDLRVVGLSPMSGSMLVMEPV